MTNPVPTLMVRATIALNPVRPSARTLSRLAAGFLAISLLLPRISLAQDTSTNSPATFLVQAVNQLVAILEPPSDKPARTFTTTIKVVKAEGLPKEAAGREVELAFQAPEHLRVAAQVEGYNLVVCRDGQELWAYAPAKKFGLLGSPDKAPFSTTPDAKDTTTMEPLKLPIPVEQLGLLPMFADIESLAGETVGTDKCRVLKITPKPEAIDALKIPKFTVKLWVRESDSMPVRFAANDGKNIDAQIDLINAKFQDAWPADKWKLKAGEGDKLQTVARSHLLRFMKVGMTMLNSKIPTLGPVTGEHRVVAREGNGRLEEVDGTKVLILKGTPEEMGHQHGILMKDEIHRLVEQILFGVGVGTSFEKGTWVFGEIEGAQKRLNPFMDVRYYQEMDALAVAAELPKEEVRLANFFPEMFHCSGFAVFGKATKDGKLYHGRVLDYMRGMGLEQSAAVMVFQPDKGNAWVNVGYAGFIGSVTAMNEKHIAMGEMGGRGEGNWDGKPMAELVREVMEKANTLDEAVEIMRKGPRTCEYYYVISDAKNNSAVGIAATPDKFQVIKPGESHELLPNPSKDTVLMSAGDRYEELARRVKANYGKFDAAGARDLMTRPVCMTSNLHSALFEPGTLDFWVANADSKSPAAHCRYTHYNLAELLKPEKAQ
ncbi:MAG: C45 family autoproteolytic acyltransferase/hydrolase [Verrucomicrobiota bacterium]